MLLISFGTRPEFIKVKPVIDSLDQSLYKILFTGQHTDLLKEISTPQFLEIKSGFNRLDSIVCSVLNNEEIFDGVTSVMVQGDTTSAFAVALAAFHRKIKIIHLEAGLRTNDKENPYPEEFNRRSISAMADIHFCPTTDSSFNLRREGISKGIYVVGNTVLDHLIDVNPTITNNIVVTLHRRENHLLMKEWFESLEALAKNNSKYTFILPIHPNPNVQKYKNLLKNVKVVDPMSHKNFTNLLSSCKLVITDSGGLQEEASFFKKRVIVCRKTTERSEGMGDFFFLCAEPNNLEQIFLGLERMNEAVLEGCPFGDGHSAKRIKDILYEKRIL